MVDALSSGLPVAAEHLQVLQRLRQLTAWQQAQQERLRAHQQEQIARLRGDVSSLQQPHQKRTEISPQPLTDIAGELFPSTLAISRGPLTGDEAWSSLQPAVGEVGEEREAGGEGEEGELVRGEGERGSVCDSGLGTGAHDSEEEERQPQPVAGEDRPIQPGVGEGDTFEDMLKRQLRLHSSKQNEVQSPGLSLQHKPHPFLKRGEGLAKYGGGQRSTRKPIKPVTKTRKTGPVSPSSKRRGSTHQRGEGRGHLLGSRFSSDESFIIRGSQRVQQEEAELVEFEELEKAAFDTSCFSQCSLVTALVGGVRGGASEAGSEEEGGGGEDLDKTLTPSQTQVEENEEGKEREEKEQREERKEREKETQKAESLAAGLVFSDDEEWESFSRGSPTPPTRTSQPREGSSGPPSLWGSPDRHQCASSTPLPLSPSPPPPPISIHHSENEHETTPPPSTLTSRLFPALRQDKNKQLKTQPVEKKITPPVATPPRYPSEAEVRERLSQLEAEIKRFRSLNSRLDQQTREKEESLNLLKRELAEFQLQKKQETEQFENYKREEIRKLKRERRVFESYVQESRAGQERRDREEMENLRSQVQRLEEEMVEREERWRTAVGRQRQRVEALEAQNRELVADLRMMERERLTWWQEQLERERQNTPSPPPPVLPPPPPSPPPPTTTGAPPAARGRGGVRRRSGRPGRRQPGGRGHQKKESPPPQRTGGERAGGKGSETARNSGRSGANGNEADKTDSEADITSKMGANGGDGSSNSNSCGSDSCGGDGNRTGSKVGSGGTSDGQVLLTTCEIVDVVSRDLSPQSDLWSDSEAAGSDVSALADDIVDRVMGPRWSGWGQGAESHRGQSPPDREVKKSGSGKSVRFAVDMAETDGGGEMEDEREDKEEEGPLQREVEQEDGSRLVVCANGTRKVVSRDGQSVSLVFTNGDTKHIKPDGTVVYRYHQSQTTHITHPDGLEEIHFPNHQTEKVYPDGRKEVRFPDGTVKTVQQSGEEESVFSDGTVQRLLLDGRREIHYPNGQREIHTLEFKKREYPDGTVKTVFPDGRQETRYASGRVRVKDSAGHLLVDS